uniref:poly-beta-hydroxybutyrate polymerase N-terminal domain-containing protein n=1 Tax=Cupriavidus yeoncheonensis TaxID=1462994 RepID=UPI003F4936AA
MDEAAYCHLDRRVRVALAQITGGVSLISLGLAGVDWALQTAVAPGKDRPAALSDLNRPIFMVGTEHDHVSPWRSVYKLCLLAGTALTFVLTSGGHNAGIVSEPNHPRRRYRISTQPPGEPYLSPEQFLVRSAYHEGSW